jgi:hypothetical protein
VKNGTLILGGAAVIVAAVVAATFMIFRLDGAARDTAPAAAAPVDAPALVVPVVAPEAQPPATTSASGPGVAAPEPRVTPATIRGRRAARADVDWAEVPVALRVNQLGPAIAADVKASLEEARAGMGSCFRAEALALAGKPPQAEDPDRPFGGPAVLVLQLESRDGAVDVVDVEVATLGTSTEGLATCCGNVLRGWRIPAAGSTTGKRFRLKLPLQ